MIKIVSSIAMAGMMVFAVSGQAQAQERALRSITAGPAAPLQKSMTQAQARKLCNQEMRGARETRAALKTKMDVCMRGKMEGN